MGIITPKKRSVRSSTQCNTSTMSLPIHNRLANELMATIFELAAGSPSLDDVESQSFPEDRFNFRLVSKAWNIISLGTPALWTWLSTTITSSDLEAPAADGEDQGQDTSSEPSALLSWIARSGSLPIGLKLRIDVRPPQTREAFLNFCQPFAPRVHYLELSFPHLNSVHVWGFDLLEYPNLRTFRLTRHNPEYSKALAELQKLPSRILARHKLLVSSKVFGPSLTNLELLVDTWDMGYNHVHLILELCPNLVGCKVSMSSLFSETNPLDLLVLPNLTTFSCRVPTPGIPTQGNHQVWLEKLILPALVDLEIVGMVLSDGLLEFYKSSMCPLEMLTVSCLVDETFIEFLKTQPELTNLKKTRKQGTLRACLRSTYLGD
ncbi:hypothetical protein BDN72DRAFT_963151 [Pluteus cervinus]|uniref:Uncharacterized protein n=1 Tax=Pluteus cervinus TaxID=181527 RepID=A0ACD3AF42_9AGAR|nr:hypothetical protein BDN72DRAFT_963151 [Pluteus cervinus]